MVPLIGFLVLVIDLYIWVVIASAILSWLIAFNVVNTSNRFVYSVAETLYRLTEPALRPIRSIIPNLGGIDISPVILILFLLFLRDVVLLGWICRPWCPSPLFERGQRQARASPRRGRNHAAGAAHAEILARRDRRHRGGEAVLQARVRALPEAGRANQALAKLIAHWLKLPPSSVSVAQGGKSRMKHVLVEGDAATLAPLIEARLADLAR